MKRYYRVMLGKNSMYADQCARDNFIGADYGIEENLAGKLPDDWREFNRKYIPIFLKGTPELDMALATLLSVIGGLVIWGKVNRALEKKRLVDKVDALRQRNGELQANLLRVMEEKGRNHPETGYAYRELGKNMEALGQREQARQVHLQEREIFRETLGAASPEASFWAGLEKRTLSGPEL